MNLVFKNIVWQCKSISAGIRKLVTESNR